MLSPIQAVQLFMSVRLAVASIATSAAMLLAPAAHAQGACGSDVNRDGVVGPTDLVQVLGAWGTCSNCAADANRDGLVNSTDLLSVLVSWGQTCTVPTWATVLEYTPDPAIVTDPALREAIAATGRPWRVRRNGNPQIEMLLVPPGSFQRGCSPSVQSGCAGDESPVHMVTLTSAFYLGRYEVTQAQWTAVMGLNPAHFQGPSYPNSGNRPVEKVSHIMAGNFCSSIGMRLPTEAEWEFAYRAGTTTAYHSVPGSPDGTDDEKLVGSIGWNERNSGNQTHNVGGLAPNGFGFHDMAGNVYEWCQDRFGTYLSTPQVDPVDESSPTTYRVLRGGSFNLPPFYLRSSKRWGFLPNYQFSWIMGLRVARSP